MDFLTWIAIGGGSLLTIALLVYFAPARTTLVLDTATTTARADMRVLWGLGPILHARAVPKESVGPPLKLFNDAIRIGHALMTPGLGDALYEAVRKLFGFGPSVSKLQIAVNLGDPARNLVVQTAVQAAFAAAPVALRDVVTVTKCEAPGAELSGRFELNASPAQISAIWSRFRDNRAVREFRKRLKKPPKQSKKAPKEVRAA